MFVIRTDLPEWLLARPVAHRGLHSNPEGVPENSLASARACIDADCPMEIDVRLLADGRLVVFHDGTLVRMTGQTGRIARLNTTELQRLTLVGTRERVPLLAELLAAIAGAVPLLIEVKCETFSARRIVKALVRELNDYAGPYAVQSFNPAVLRHLERLAPQIPRGLLSGWNLGTSFVWLCRPNMLCQEVRRLDDASVQKAWRRGVPLLAWVVRDAESRSVAIRLADNYIFEEEPNFAKPIRPSVF